MTNPNQPGYKPEQYDPQIEAFIPIENVKIMVGVALVHSGRIDLQGTVQPIEEKRFLHDAKWALGPRADSLWRDDIFVPSREEMQLRIVTDETGRQTKNAIVDPHLPFMLYKELAGMNNVKLTHEQAKKVRIDRGQLEDNLEGNTQYAWKYSEEQSSDAYHVKINEKPTPDFAETRIYVPGGVEAVSIANSIFKAGAEMQYAKIWTPHATTQEQSIRTDTPLFAVTTFRQLESVMSVLRAIAADGKLPRGMSPLAGHEVDDLPGVYIGQTVKGNSFNGRMEDIFGKAIQEAASDVKLRAGDILTEETFTAIAIRAREISHSKAAEWGTNVDHHAFLEGQPVAAILKAIQQY